MKNLLRVVPTLLAIALFWTSSAQGFYLDGKGNYAVKGATRTNPGFSASGDHQAIHQYFNLTGEIRANERTSFFTEMRLFENPRAAYWGDTTQPDECYSTPDPADPNTTTTANRSNCTNAHQDSLHPRYEAITPMITKAYARFAFDYCLIEAGRRGRDWGIGILHDSGEAPFSTSYSVFDGVTCDINIQKSKTLGFQFGYDKLAETGAAYYIDQSSSTARYGANESNDDIEQFFVSILYDDTKANAGSGFTRQVGIYFANILGDAKDINVKIADLYTAFYFNDLSFRNEIIFRLGSSADPNLKKLGGSRTVYSDQVISNDVQSIGFAGDLKYTLSRSGSAIGPKEYKKGNSESHSLSLTYAYAPGDRDGYKEEFEQGNNGFFNGVRNTTVEAMMFHQNYKPTIILFNHAPHTTGNNVDGIFNASHVMNASVFTLGYEYESFNNGNFGIKLATARMVVSMTKDQREANEAAKTWVVGQKGKNLGYELDITYDRDFGRDMSAGIAAAIAAPGEAWKGQFERDEKSIFAIESFLSFSF